MIKLHNLYHMIFPGVKPLHNCFQWIPTYIQDHLWSVKRNFDIKKINKRSKTSNLYDCLHVWLDFIYWLSLSYIEITFNLYHILIYFLVEKFSRRVIVKRIVIVFTRINVEQREKRFTAIPSGNQCQSL